MDKRDAVNAVRRYGAAVQLRYGAARLYLFGSYAKGTFHKDSDIDVAVVFDNCGNALERAAELMRLRREIDLRIEPHPFRQSDFTPDDPLAYEVLKYGSQIC